MGSLQSVLVVPDTHAPFHDPVAWNLMLKAGEFLKPHILVHNGDLGDFFSVSKHSKAPSRRKDWSLVEEAHSVNECLDELDSLGAKRKVITLGNHENRYDRYIADKAPELDGITSVADLYQLEQRDWECVPYMESLKIGQIFYTHDVGIAGRYAVHRSLDAFQHSVVTGHTHRFGLAVEGNAVGDSMVAASFGWLGDVDQMDYYHRTRARRDWSLGFGYGYLNPQTGVTSFVPVPIIKLKTKYICVVEGTQLSEKVI